MSKISPLRARDSASYHDEVTDADVEDIVELFYQTLQEWKVDGYKLRSVAIVFDAHRGEDYRVGRRVLEQRLSETVTLLEMAKHQVLQEMFG